MFRILLTLLLLAVSYPLQLTDDASSGQPAWSPDGKQIAYIHAPGYESEIFIMNADGSGVTQVTFVADEHAQPVWSPDGKRIAFLGGASLDWDLFVTQVGSGGVTNLTNDRKDIDHLTWSPNSGRIAFDALGQVTGESSLMGQQIWMAAADGSGVSQLTSEPEASSAPSWSPDGTRIAFHRSGHIWVMNADGSNASQLTSGAWGGCCPSWSPDGKQIAYLHPLAGWPNVGLVVMNSDGGGQQILATGNLSGPAWSPDSRRLAYIKREPYQLAGGDVWIVHADGSAPAKLTDESKDGLFTQPIHWSSDGLSILCHGLKPSADTFEEDVFLVRPDGSEVVNLTNSSSMDFDPTWSPDGGQIAFASTRSEGHSELWVTDPRGVDPEQIHVGRYLSNPKWSPDGERILLTSSPERTSRVVTLQRSGGDVQTLTPGEEGGSMPDWSPDGSRIVYVQANQIWAMDADGGNPAQLTDSESLKTGPLWSPDGEYILYRDGYYSESVDSFWIMGADGGNPRQLVDRAADRRLSASPDWSPDSRTVVYAGICDDPADAETSTAYGPVPDPSNRSICLVNTDGSGLTELVPSSEDYRDPAFAPDGSRIAYAASASDEGGVYVLDLDTQTVFRIAETGERPAWSPDGRLIVTGYPDIRVLEAP